MKEITVTREMKIELIKILKSKTIDPKSEEYSNLRGLFGGTVFVINEILATPKADDDK